MSKLFVACALLLCLGLANAQDSAFPYCRCVDRDSESSPYIVKLKTTSSGSGRYTATFTVTDAATPANPSSCYKRILEYGVPKIELGSSPACLAAGNKPTVTVNGKPSLSSGAVPPPNFGEKAAIKITLKPNYKGGPLEFSVTGYGACANWNTLFNARSFGVFQWAVFSIVLNGNVCCPYNTYAPPPPLPVQPARSPIQPARSPVQPALAPPPPTGPGPNGFPYCRCDKSTANTPYRVASIRRASSTTPAGVTWWTITLRRAACDASKGSCTFNLEKIETLIRPVCKSSIYPTAYVTPYGGETEARTFQFQSYGAGKLVGKVTRLDWTPAEAAGATVSIGTYTNSACPSPAQLFYNPAQVAFFSKNNQYCPTFDI